MASSAVSSVLYLRAATGNRAETRTGASKKFPRMEFRTRLRIAGKSGDQHIEAMSKVRGDAIIAAQEAGFDSLCGMVGGRPCDIDTLISHVQGMVFPFD